MSRISDVLRGKGSAVATIPPDAPVGELLAGLAERNIGAMVVLDGDLVVGIVSERDVIRGLSARGAALIEISVAEIMTRDVVSCDPEDEVDTVMRTMTDRRIRHLPVLDGGRLSGIVSIGDLVKARIGELEDERAHLHSYLAAGP